MTLFDHCATQWRAGGLGVVGLDYTACRAVAEDLGVVWSYGLLRKLQVIERMVLERVRNDTHDGDSQGAGGAGQDTGR